jgi:hypothetical protein
MATTFPAGSFFIICRHTIEGQHSTPMHTTQRKTPKVGQLLEQGIHSGRAAN